MKGLGPLVLLAALAALFLRFGPLGVFQPAFPPVEELTVEHITLPRLGEIQVQVVNGGPQAVTIGQVSVDDAIWRFEIDGSNTIGRLESRTLTIPYPWVEGEPHEVALVTSTGLTFTAGVEVATQTPSLDARYIGTFAMLGVYVGVIPVLLGLLWLPFLRSIHRRWLDFFLSLTLGLLIFLGVNALAESLETAGLVAGAFQGLGVVVLGFLGAVLILAALGGRQAQGRHGEASPFYVATLIALGIGLHNLGEGLAIGAAYATGEIALGTFLVVGFLIHNTTEGLGIVAPVAAERPQLRRLLLLGLLAGVPTIPGAWIGGFTYAPIWVTLFLAMGAGAIAQVIYLLWNFFARPEGGGGLAGPLNAAGLVLGMLIMYATGLLVAA
ncbi:MAG: metal transporter [Gemmatimonas sp.]|nr:metal transporter [Gemmatimonas sp.]